MTENITVTMPLQEFEEMQRCDKEYKRLAGRISACYDYSYKENPVMSKECLDCENGIDCPECEVYKNNPPYIEELTLSVEMLIEVTKEYALFGKDVDVNDIDTIPIRRIRTRKK